MKLTPIPYYPDGTRYFRALATLTGCVWLDSGKPASKDGRYDIFSALPDFTVENIPPAELASSLIPKLSSAPESTSLPFAGGWIGFLGYEYAHANFNLQAKTPYRCPQSWFGWYSWALIQDHQQQTAVIITTQACTSSKEQTVHAALQTHTGAVKESFTCGKFAHSETHQQYLQNVAQIKQYILAGDCYQTNYTQRFSAKFKGSATAAYETLRNATPNPYCAFLALPNNSYILSLSQERFLQFDHNQVFTAPIKGTIARKTSTQADELAKNTLVNSDKNRAENLMIVDLLRNDFSKNCLPHSVKTPSLFEIKTYANVHHLVSTVTGTLKPSVNHVEFLLDCFPGGSITGAPKKRAMEIIHELEYHARGPYCGAIGYFSANGNSDFNISIRTFLQEDNQLFCWAGGGIVADSDPEQEYQESLQKVASLMCAVAPPQHN